MLVVRPLEQLVRLREAPDPRLEDRLRRRPVPSVLGRDALASCQPLGLVNRFPQILVNVIKLHEMHSHRRPQGFHVNTGSTTVAMQTHLCLDFRGRELVVAEVARELLREVGERRPSLRARLAAALEVVLLERLAPLLDGGGGEGGAVRVRDLLALGDRLRGEGQRAVAVIDTPLIQ